MNTVESGHSSASGVVPQPAKRRRGKQERSGKACECGRPKVVGKYACPRCRELEQSGFMAGDSSRDAGMCGVVMKGDGGAFLDVDRACDAWLRKRGLISSRNYWKS